MIERFFTASAIVLCLWTNSVQAQIATGAPGDTAPTTESDVSSLIQTGDGYDAWGGCTQRRVLDFEIPGAIAGSGLRWERTYSSATNTWNFAYTWRLYGAPFGPDQGVFPDGHSTRFLTGSKERLAQTGSMQQGGGSKQLYLEDGSMVYFDWEYDAADPQTRYPAIDYYTPQSVTDRYGRETSLDWYTIGGDPYQLHLGQITDPSGRYIRITYGLVNQTLPTRVEGSDGHWVNYTWGTVPVGNSTANVLLQADYSDGTSAYYTYTTAPYWSETRNANDGTVTHITVPAPVLQTAQDVRAEGPMQSIYYEYWNPGHMPGQLYAEHHLDFVGPSPTPGVVVSSLTKNMGKFDVNGVQTETRGDGPTRTIRMAKLSGTYQGKPFVTFKSDYNGVLENYGYNNSYFLNSVTDRNGKVTNFTLESFVGNPTRRTHPDGTHIDYVYSDPLYPYYVKTVTDENGQVTTSLRFPHSTNTTPVLNENLIYEIDHPDGGTETFSYNTSGQILTHKLPDNKTDNSHRYKHYQYYPTGLLQYEWYETTTDHPVDTEPRTTYVYYAANDPVAGNAWIDRLKTKTPPANAQGGVNVETYEYDRALDSVTGLTNPSGTPVAGRGLVTKISYPNDTHGGTISGGTYKSFGYDKFGNKRWEENELRQRTSYLPDEYKRVTMVTPPSPAGTTTYDFSPTPGNSALSYNHTTNLPYFITDPVSIVTAHTYDPNWRLSATTVGYGNAAPNKATMWFGYDPVGNQTKVTDPRGTGLGDPNYTTTTAYDNRNRKTTVTDPQSHVTTFGYDGASNVTSITRADGSKETKQYDPVNRVSSDTMPKTGPAASPTETITTTFLYNPSGSLRSVTVPQSAAVTLTTTFDYDASDMKTKMFYPAPSTDYQQWTVDNVKNLISRRTVNGTTQNFTYDSRNRKLGMTWSNGLDSATFDYDAAGRLTTANNPNSNITRGYDAAGRLTLDRQSIGTLGTKDVQYLYDAANKQTELYLTSAAYDYTFSYDPMGRFEKIIPSGSGVAFQYYYDVASNETERFTWLNSVGQFYTRDNLNRMSRRDIKLGANTLAYEAYGYDNMSRLISIDREDNKRDAFTYYLNSELLNVQYGLVNGINPNRTVNYTIDRSGNRTNVSDNNVNTSYLPNNLNQYNGTVGAIPITNGSEHEISSYQNASYTYINDERLTSVTLGSNNYVLGYDALGRCVKRTLNSGTTYFIYDGEKPIVEYSSAGATNAKNLYGKAIDETLMRTDYTVTPNKVLYYQQDHEGSVTHLTDATGAIIETYRYDVFGAPTINSGSRSDSAFGNRFMFTGREYASSTFGFYEYRARAYHPGLGRFMSEDPKLFDGGDYNLFRYCDNDPEDLTDPMGLTFNDGGYELRNQSERTQFGETSANITSDVSLLPVAGGVRATVVDINMRPHSIINTLEKQSYDKPNWKNGPDEFKRSKENIDRTIHHEGDHRDHARQEYDKSHDKVIDKINDKNKDKVFKTGEQAQAAIKKDVDNAFKKFIKQEHEHSGPLWPGYKAPPHEHPGAPQHQQPK